MKWKNSFRAIAALIVLLMDVFVISVGLFTGKIPPEVTNLVTFLNGLVVGGYFSKRDERVNEP